MVNGLLSINFWNQHLCNFSLPRIRAKNTMKICYALLLLISVSGYSQKGNSPHGYLDSVPHLRPFQFLPPNSGGSRIPKSGAHFREWEKINPLLALSFSYSGRITIMMPDAMVCLVPPQWIENMPVKKLQNRQPVDRMPGSRWKDVLRGKSCELRVACCGFSDSYFVSEF